MTRTIALRNVRKTYPGVIANDDVTIEFNDGEVHCLLGENGAGKSTLINILAGMQLPDSGTVEVDGSPIEILSPKRAMEYGIGVVYQHSTLVGTLSVIENLMLGEDGLRLNFTRAKARLEELATLLGADIDPDTQANDLGLGQQQQVEIAKAMWKRSRLLILDEPTSMLTPQAIETLTESIERLKHDGVAVILVTHKLREAYTIGDCVTVLRGGKNVGHISPQNMLRLSQSEAQDAILDLMFPGDLSTAGKREEAAEMAGASEAERSTGTINLATQPLALQLCNVSATGAAEEIAATNVDLSLHEGEILGVAGIDGHGQTSLAEAIAGERHIMSGTIWLNAHNITNDGVRARRSRGLRYVSDDRLHQGTVGDLSVAVNLMLKQIGAAPYWRWGFTNMHTINSASRRLVDAYNIATPSLSTRAAALSGGNIQKIILARELDEDAGVVIANKPTYGLDLKTVDLVHRLLDDFVTAGGSLLLLSNELDELVALSHRICVISQGRLVGLVNNDGPTATEKVGTLMIGGGDDEYEHS